MAEFALFVLVLLASFVGMVVLWRRIDDETENPPRMSREDAERVARADTDESESNSGRDGR
jgi:hypothetical protein